MAVHAGECLAKRGGLDDALVGEMLMRRGDDAKARRGLVPAGHARRFGSELAEHVLVPSLVWAVTLGRLLLESGLNDMALLLADAHAALKLLLHYRILGHEAWGEAGQADLLDAQPIPRREGPTCAWCSGVGAATLRQVQPIRPTPRRVFGGPGFLFNNNLRCRSVTRSARGRRL